MGRSNNNNTASNMISGESGSTYVTNFPSVASHNPHQQLPHSLHHLQHNPSIAPHQMPSSPSHSQYLSVSQLTNPHLYEANNNLTPPARGYSPLSHGSNSSSGSAISYASNGSGVGHNPGALSIMDAIVSNVKYEYEDFPQEPDGGPVKIATWKDHVAVFNLDQVGVMCDVLLQEGDISRLIDVLSTVAKDFVGRSEKILRAQAHVAYHAALEDARRFPQVYKILEENSFSPQYHQGLQKLWFAAHYKEAEITRGRPLGAVDKYRIRRKFPLPRTIWDGEETVYCFKERSRNILRESFRREKYPNLDEKKKLSKLTDLSMTQVGNWFKNKRQREKEKEKGKATAKRCSKNAYNTSAAIAAAMNPELLGMMLNPGSLNPGHGHLHPHHHQQQLAPRSPEDLEGTLRKVRVDEARLKSYIDEGMYSTAVAVAASSASPGSGSPPANFQSYLHASSNHNGGVANCHNNSSRHLVLPGKSDITIGIVGSNQHSGPSPRPNNGLIITAIPSPQNNPTSSISQQHHPHLHSPGESNGEERSNGGGASPSNPEQVAAANYGSRPRSNTSDTTPGQRCGAELLPYLHHASHHHHHHHNPYHHHPHHHPHLHVHPNGASPNGYENGLPPLIHNAALSHA